MVAWAGPLVAAVAAASLVACGREAARPAAIPADALPGVPGQAVALDAVAVTADAIDLATLEALLDDAGFVAGSQRAFGQVSGGRQRALARVIVFETGAGAHRYLAWLREHADEVIGDAQALDRPARPGGFVVVSEGSACCPKASRVFLAGWADGAAVVTLEVGGDGVRPRDVVELASMLDAAV